MDFKMGSGCCFKSWYFKKIIIMILNVLILGLSPLIYGGHSFRLQLRGRRKSVTPLTSQLPVTLLLPYRSPHNGHPISQPQLLLSQLVVIRIVTLRTGFWVVVSSSCPIIFSLVLCLFSYKLMAGTFFLLS